MEEKIVSIKIADEDVDGGFLLLTPKGAGSVNGSGESINFDTDTGFLFENIISV